MKSCSIFGIADSAVSPISALRTSTGSSLQPINSRLHGSSSDSIGFIQRDLNDKMDDVKVKVGSGNTSITSAINDFVNRKLQLETLTKCINSGKDSDECYS